MQNITDYLLLNGFTKIGSTYLKGNYAVVVEPGNIHCYRKDGESYLRFIAFQSEDLDHSTTVFFFHAVGIVPLKAVVHQLRGVKSLNQLKSLTELN